MGMIVATPAPHTPLSSSGLAPGPIGQQAPAHVERWIPAINAGMTFERSLRSESITPENMKRWVLGPSPSMTESEIYTVRLAQRDRAVMFAVSPTSQPFLLPSSRRRPGPTATFHTSKIVRHDDWRLKNADAEALVVLKPVVGPGLRRDDDAERDAHQNRPRWIPGTSPGMTRSARSPRGMSR